MSLCVFVYSIESEKCNKLNIKNDNNEAQNTTCPIIFANFVHDYQWFWHQTKPDFSTDTVHQR